MSIFFRPAFTRFALTIVTGFSIALPLHAATKTWTGGSPAIGGNSNWTTGANWGGTAPVAGADLLFAGKKRTTNTNDFVNTSFTSITFKSKAAAFNLGGNTLFIGNGTSGVGGITNNSTNVQTLGFNVADSLFPVFNGIGLNNNQTWNAASGDLMITATKVQPNGFKSGGNVTLTIAGAGSQLSVQS